jgi:hypothetical protein
MKPMVAAPKDLRFKGDGGRHRFQLLPCLEYCQAVKRHAPQCRHATERKVSFPNVACFLLVPRPVGSLPGRDTS